MFLPSPLKRSQHLTVGFHGSESRYALTKRSGILQGSTRINVRAREFFQGVYQFEVAHVKEQVTHLGTEKLRNSKYGNDEDIDSMVEHFDKSTKPTFKDPKERSYVKFGSMRDKDPAVGIKGGQLQLAGYAYSRFP